ncbi:MAG: hypothetical protein ACI87E_004134 [Mariniblastus sp.]|jgi:hypothetical protein
MVLVLHTFGEADRFRVDCEKLMAGIKVAGIDRVLKRRAVACCCFEESDTFRDLVSGKKLSLTAGKSDAFELKSAKPKFLPKSST